MARRILVVDDSRTVRRVVRLVLEPAGFEVREAESGSVALDLLSREAADLILLDFIMPGMNGFEFTRQLRAKPGIGSTPVILMSARADQIGSRFVRQTGALDAISKPFAPDVLRAVIDHVLARALGNEFADEGTIVQEALELLGGGSSPGVNLREEVSEVAQLPRPSSFPGAMSLPDVTSVGIVAPPAGFEQSGGASLALDTDAEANERTAQALAPLLQALAPLLRPGLDARDHKVAVMAARNLELPMLRTLRAQLGKVPGMYRGVLGIEGNVEGVPLAEVLQLLRLQMQSGVLVIEHKRAVVDVGFRSGNVELAVARGVSGEFLLGRYLVAARALERSALDKAIARLRSHSGWLGEALVREGQITEAQLEHALQQQSSELIYEVLRWESAHYRFEVGAAFPEAERAGLGLPVEGLLLEGYRRVDEWRLIQAELPSFELVLARDELAIDKMAADRITAEERRVLDAVDGHRTVRAVMEHLALNSFDVAKVLFRLLRARLVRRRGG